MRSDKVLGAESTAAPQIGNSDWLHRRVQFLPQPVRFLGVGGAGLITDLAVFTAIPMHANHPLAARIVSLAAATLITWRLNRALTFRASGRPQHHEALRYAGVTAISQGTSFAVFSVLVLTVLAMAPQAALIAGAAAGAMVAYAGHMLFAFDPATQPGDSDRGRIQP
jgi:putative flippase GtrA